jgi:hypothetical protein
VCEPKCSTRENLVDSDPAPRGVTVEPGGYRAPTRRKVSWLSRHPPAVPSQALRPVDCSAFVGDYSGGGRAGFTPASLGSVERRVLSTRGAARNTFDRGSEGSRFVPKVERPLGYASASACRSCAVPDERLEPCGKNRLAAQSVSSWVLVSRQYSQVAVIPEARPVRVPVRPAALRAADQVAPRRVAEAARGAAAAVRVGAAGQWAPSRALKQPARTQ